MTLFDLVAKISLDSSEYESGLDGARGKANNFARSLNGAADKVLKVGAAAAGAAVAGMTAFAKTAVDTGKQFDSAMSQVAATMGLTVDEIGELRDYAQKMGAETAFSANEAAQALNYMALAGYDATTSMKMLPNVLNLAAAGGMDLAAASDMVTDSQSALGLTLDETSSLVDKMAQAASKSNTSVSQLGDAILTVGGTAKNLKGGTTELATALGILADNGVKGAEGGTALRNIILSLTAPTDNATKTMQALGVSVFDAEGQMRSFNDIFGDLNASLGKLTQQDRVNALAQIFNNRDLKSAEALLANVGERWDELSGYIDSAQGSAQKMADTQLDNLTGDITLMNSALEGAKIAFADGITPALRNIVQMVTKALSRPKTQAYLKDVGKKLGEILKVIANGVKNALPKLLSLFDNGAKKLKILAAAVTGFVLAVKATANPLGALISGLGLLAGGMAVASLAAGDTAEITYELSDAEIELAKRSSDARQEYEDMTRAMAESYSDIDQSTEKTQDLWKELQSLADESGYVKDADKDRADFLIGELNNALGTEYEMNGNIITQYQQMQQEIDTLIEKRKAAALLSVAESRYTLATQNQQTASEDMIEAEERYTEALEGQAKAWADLNEAQNAYVAAGYQSGISPEDIYKDVTRAIKEGTEGTFGDLEYTKPIADAYKAYTEYTSMLEERKPIWEDAKKVVDSYYKDIFLYEEAQAAYEEGRFSDVEHYVRDRDILMMESSIKSGQMNREQLEEFRRTADIRIKIAEWQRKQLEKGEVGFTEKTVEEADRRAKAAIDSYKSAYDTYSDYVKEVEDETHRGIATADLSYVSRVKSEMLASYTEMIANAKQIGIDLTDGIESGIKERQKSLLDSVSNMANNAINAAKTILKIASPSKVMRGIGRFFTEGFGLGISDEEDMVTDAAEGIADSALSAFDNGSVIAESHRGDRNDDLLSILRDIRDSMGFDVVLNDGTLVGRIDKLLGQSAYRKIRGGA